MAAPEQALLRELDEIEEITPRLYTLLKELAADVVARAPSKSNILSDGRSLLFLLQKLPSFYCQRLYEAYRRSLHETIHPEQLY